MQRRRPEHLRREARRGRHERLSATSRSRAPCGSRKRSRSSRPTIRKRCRRSAADVRAGERATSIRRRNLTPDDRAKAALTALEPAREAAIFRPPGFIITSAVADALGNIKGLFAYNRATNANYTLTVRTDDGTGSGWAGADHPDWKQLDFKAVSDARDREGAAVAQSGGDRAGRYTVILEPQAVGDLVQLIGNSFRCALRRRRTERVLEAGRRQQDRREDRRRAQ